MGVKILEVHAVAPSPGGGGGGEQSLPLLYFDMLWLQFPPSETLRFYDFKCSESYFSETTVVELKNSLSLALKHFLPLASKIIFPLTSAGMPVSRYSAGDSVALTIALSDADFGNLTGNHSRAAGEFHDYVPQLPPAAYSSSDIRFSPVAVQVTLFPNQGICFGITLHHAVCDAANVNGFVETWASIHKRNGDEHSDVVKKFTPFYGRSRVQDADKLDAIVWNQMKTRSPTLSANKSLPISKVRATYILTEAQVEQLKRYVMMKKPGIGRVSSFVAVCAHLWSCLAKSPGEEVADDEPEYFTSAVDCRARLNPALPETYFGNCLVFLRATSTHGRLKGKEGLVEAAEAIAAAIRATVGNPRGIVSGFESQSENGADLIGKRWVPIAGSVRIDAYGADYGWRRAIKYECIHIDFDGAVHLCKARDGGVEIGLSMPNPKMDAFASVFNKNTYIQLVIPPSKLM